MYRNIVTSVEKIFMIHHRRHKLFEGSFIKRQTSDTSSDNEWYVEWQRMTKSDNEWPWVVISANVLFSREEPTNRHPKENPLNFEKDIEEDLLN